MLRQNLLKKFVACIFLVSTSAAVAAPPFGSKTNARRGQPVVRDHRGNGPVVRDHRGEGPVVRDHRGDGTKPPVVDADPTGGVVNDPVTPPANKEETIIYRAQIMLRTANRDDAGQDDGVLIKLNGQNATWCDSGEDDFERGKTHTYDLMLVDMNGTPTLARLRDIAMLEISKTGSDGWCVSDVELIINNVPIFRKNYPGGKWLDTGKLSTMISSQELRSHSMWQSWRSPQPSPVVPRAEIESRIESLVGHFLHGKKVGLGKVYGRSAVEASHRDAQTLHVDLDLEYSIDNFPNLEVDVDFDIVFETRNNQVAVTVRNLNVDVPSKVVAAVSFVNGLFGGTTKTQLMNYIERQIMRQLQGGRFAVPTGNYTVSVIVGGNGDVVLLPKKN